MKAWIKELCPEIADWQAELIADEAAKLVLAEREACAKVCDEYAQARYAAEAIRARMKVGYTGWFGWPAIYCLIKEIKGDTLVVELEDGRIVEIKAIEFTPKYMIRKEEK